MIIDRVQLECHGDDVIPGRKCTARDWQRMFEVNNSLCVELWEADEKLSIQNETNVGSFLKFASSSCLHTQHFITIIRDCTLKDFYILDDPYLPQSQTIQNNRKLRIMYLKIVLLQATSFTLTAFLYHYSKHIET